jgi:hypothetical protein
MALIRGTYVITMEKRESEYSIYGRLSGGPPPPESIPEGPLQAGEQAAKDRMKSRMLEILRRFDLRYPVRSRRELLAMIKTDVPGVCDTGDRKLGLRDLVTILSDEDFPLRSDHEAATILSAACPIPAVSSR